MIAARATAAARFTKCWKTNEKKGFIWTKKKVALSLSLGNAKERKEDFPKEQ